MEVVVRWSVPVSRFPGDSEEERMIAAQDAVEDIENEMLGEIEDKLAEVVTYQVCSECMTEQRVGDDEYTWHVDRDDAGDAAVSAQFLEFFDLPDGGHGQETLRARFLVSVEHPDERFIAAVVSHFGGEVKR